MVSVTFESRRLEALFKKMEKRGKNMRPMFNSFAARIHNEVMMNFRRQGSYGDVMKGKPSLTFKSWKPLSSMTLASRAAAGQGTAILQASSMLRGSIGTVRRVTNKSLEFGSTAKVGAILHGGGVIRPNRSKYLTLPFPGVRGRARQYPDTFFIISKKGNLILATSEDGVFKPLFLLKEQVKMPSRPFLTIGTEGIRDLQKIALRHLMS